MKNQVAFLIINLATFRRKGIQIPGLHKCVAVSGNAVTIRRYSVILKKKIQYDKCFKIYG